MHVREGHKQECGENVIVEKLNVLCRLLDISQLITLRQIGWKDNMTSMNQTITNSTSMPVNVLLSIPFIIQLSPVNSNEKYKRDADI